MSLFFVEGQSKFWRELRPARRPPGGLACPAYGTLPRCGGILVAVAKGPRTGRGPQKRIRLTYWLQMLGNAGTEAEENSARGLLRAHPPRRADRNFGESFVPPEGRREALACPAYGTLPRCRGILVAVAIARLKRRENSARGAWARAGPSLVERLVEKAFSTESVKAITRRALPRPLAPTRRWPTWGGSS